jgi:hypothetical protein
MRPINSYPTNLIGRVFCVGWACMTIFMVPALHAKDAVVYTSLKESDCRPPEPAVQAQFEQRGVTAQRCPGIAGIGVFAVSSDANSWLEFEYAKSIWSSEKPIVYQEPVRSFPNLGGTKMEWHVAPNGRPEAAIFRIASQSKKNQAESVRELFVFRFVGGAIHYCGAETTNIKARALLVMTNACTVPIPSRPVP